MTTNPDVLAAASQRRWMAYHVFYGGNPEVLLEECLLPLAAQLEEEGLVRLSFYINYWLEGGHVRLRLLPAQESARDEIDRRVMADVSDYLVRRPSMHPMARIDVPLLLRRPLRSGVRRGAAPPATSTPRAGRS